MLKARLSLLGLIILLVPAVATAGEVRKINIRFHNCTVSEQTFKVKVTRALNGRNECRKAPPEEAVIERPTATRIEDGVWRLMLDGNQEPTGTCLHPELTFYWARPRTGTYDDGVGEYILHCTALEKVLVRSEEKEGLRFRYESTLPPRQERNLSTDHEIFLEKTARVKIILELEGTDLPIGPIMVSSLQPQICYKLDKLRANHFAATNSNTEIAGPVKESADPNLVALGGDKLRRTDNENKPHERLIICNLEQTCPTLLPPCND